MKRYYVFASCWQHCRQADSFCCTGNSFARELDQAETALISSFETNYLCLCLRSLGCVLFISAGKIKKSVPSRWLSFLLGLPASALATSSSPQRESLFFLVFKDTFIEIFSFVECHCLSIRDCTVFNSFTFSVLQSFPFLFAAFFCIILGHSEKLLD